MKRGMIKNSHPIVKVFAAGMFGAMVGRMSYQKVLMQRLAELPHSEILEFYKLKRRNPLAPAGPVDPSTDNSQAPLVYDTTLLENRELDGQQEFDRMNTSMEELTPP